MRPRHFVYARVTHIWSRMATKVAESMTFGFKLVDVGATLGAYFGVDGGVLVLTCRRR